MYISQTKTTMQLLVQVAFKKNPPINPALRDTRAKLTASIYVLAIADATKHEAIVAVAKEGQIGNANIWGNKP